MCVCVSVCVCVCVCLCLCLCLCALFSLSLSLSLSLSPSLTLTLTFTLTFSSPFALPSFSLFPSSFFLFHILPLFPHFRVQSARSLFIRITLALSPSSCHPSKIPFAERPRDRATVRQRDIERQIDRTDRQVESRRSKLSLRLNQPPSLHLVPTSHEITSHQPNQPAPSIITPQSGHSTLILILLSLSISPLLP